MPAPEVEPRSFPEILQRVWWRLDRALDERSLRAAARFYLAEARLAGTAALIDHHESPKFICGSLDLLADACQELGMPAVLCYGITERNRGRLEAQCGLDECRRFLLHNRRPLVRGMVGLHASFTVSDDTIERAGDLCREFGTALHVHVAEDTCDVDDARSRGFAGPLERLRDLDALVPGSILAHGVHLSPDQVRMAEDQGCWFVQNPRSNLGNRVGYASSLAECGRVALGTDGYPSDMSVELSALLEDGRRHGEAEVDLRTRLARGRELVVERFGGVLPPEAASAPGQPGECDGAEPHRTALPSTDLLETIRAEARLEAERLWARMRGL
jgi:cytosine/adenosine deaminase-related metal-dependent hydrolase